MATPQDYSSIRCCLFVRNTSQRLLCDFEIRLYRHLSDVGSSNRHPNAAFRNNPNQLRSRVLSLIFRMIDAFQGNKEFMLVVFLLPTLDCTSVLNGRVAVKKSQRKIESFGAGTEQNQTPFVLANGIKCSR